MPDHRHIFLKVALVRQDEISRARPITFRLFNDTSYKSFIQYIRDAIRPWFNTAVALTPNKAFDFFFSKFSEAFENFYPKKTKIIQAGLVERNNLICPKHLQTWYTPELAQIKL